MIDLTKGILPSSIQVDGKYYAIKTDFHYWINFVLKLKEENHLQTDFDFLYLNQDEIPENRNAGFDQLFNFAFPKSELPRPSGRKSDVIPYDWELDADLIYAAFWQMYNIDLCDEKLNLHWYKFMALFNSLKGTKFDDVIGYRYYNPSKKPNPEKEYSALKRQWEIKHRLTAKEQKTLDNFRSHLKC